MFSKATGSQWIWLVVLVLVGVWVARGRFGSNTTREHGDVDFQQQVLAADRPVLVKFGADWCGPCRMMEGPLDNFEASSEGKVRVVRVDVDHHRQLAKEYHVSSIPHTLLFIDGKIVNERIGYMDENTLDEFVTSSVARHSLQ
jgi:thioredoxin 1